MKNKIVSILIIIVAVIISHVPLVFCWNNYHITTSSCVGPFLDFMTFLSFLGDGAIRMLLIAVLPLIIAGILILWHKDKSEFLPSFATLFLISSFIVGFVNYATKFLNQ